MNLRIVNETSYKKIRIICDNKITLLKKNEVATFNYDSDRTRIQIDVLDKNRTFFFILALFDIWIWDFITTDSAVFSLNCSISFDVICGESTETLVLKNFDYTEKVTHCDFNSVYVKNNNSTISNIKFFSENIKKLRNKTLNNLFWFVSGIPVVILAFCLLYKYPEYDFLLLFPSFIIPLCTIPSVVKSVKIWKFCKNEYINMFLSQKEAILRQNNGEKPPYVPTGVVEKRVYNFLNKIFKKIK